MDRVAARQALELKLVEHKKWAGTSSLPVSREFPHISMNTKASNTFISATEKELKEMCAIDNNPALATIGTISVSSGIDAKDDPFNPDAKKEREDWALAKMLPSIECQNFLDKNVLAPNCLQGKGQEVLGVRSWKDNEEWDRLNVFKRGGTTDYTVGTVQGMRRHLEGEGIQSVATHVIVSEEQERPFSKRGDSGSWVIDSHGLLVGMIWGKSDFDDTTYFTPADYIFRYIPERILQDGGPTAQVCKILKKKLNFPAESIFEIAPRSRAGTPSKFIDLLATTKAITNTS
ncbi:hypothetical protein BDV34DRAFT_192416 [Aspergillus parasiticus]|uniref:Uncharacterized protein n=1 Tax=Aspergillus parasiticus TaxID=5067 RepID=A0A5N6DQ07_ASPPA|nr:hypothetical protein BDV34DRAFT_192416 [Aspergillus parasiticus]